MALLIISTVPNEDMARDLSKILLEKRVAACVNIIPKVRSNYWWNGSIENSEEIILLIKTTEDKYDQLEDLIRKNHPYEIPEIIAFEIKKGFNKYLNWIKDETRSFLNFRNFRAFDIRIFMTGKYLIPIVDCFKVK